MTPSTADEQPVAIAQAAPITTDISTEPPHHDADVEVAPPIAEDNITVSGIEETPSASATDIGINAASSLETSAEVQTVVVDEISVPSIEAASEPVDTSEVIGSDPPAELQASTDPEVAGEPPAPSADVEAVDNSQAAVGSGLPVELLANVEPEVDEEAPTSSAEIDAIAASELAVGSDASSELPEEVEPEVAEQASIAAAETETMPVVAPERVVVDDALLAVTVTPEPVAIDETPVIVVEAEATAPVAIEVSIDSEPAPSVAAEIVPDVADDLPAVPAVAAENTATDAADVAAQVEPAQAPAPKSPAATKARAKIVEPADRATLIRQRWAETGSRMWNPRLHGTGEATLNIQGRIGLLPPEPGETMPRYDKLEFKMLGGQIVCEGVIVEAPAHASQRGFTRLAEPRSADRNREPARERQAALA
ncbi:hypothetical protein [Bradyrhizobium sp. CCBAU 53340]|uniref:hypothetical protein n=1 Tax=Bradyrhizobium sp. CCBAU 53340 TaxID=1325112 RepID=UPI001FED4228|nr:hypothetical protein [Bradyrhizobium sp. CCBAU 53340]